MIFVVFGNGPIPFFRLARKIDEIAANLEEEAIIQSGHTKYDFKNLKSRKFFSSNEMSEMIDKASVIISHGGYGTISECLKKGKTVVAVPRFQGEANHSQEDLVKTLEVEGCIIGVYDINDLEKSIFRAREFKPKPLPKGNVSQVINEFIKKVFPEQWTDRV